MLERRKSRYSGFIGAVAVGKERMTSLRARIRLRYRDCCVMGWHEPRHAFRTWGFEKSVAARIKPKKMALHLAIFEVFRKSDLRQ